MDIVQDSEKTKEQLIAEIETLRTQVKSLQQADNKECHLEKNIINLLESINDGFLALDSQGRYTYANWQAEQLLGKTRSQLIGNNFWEVLPVSSSSELYLKFQQAIATNTACEFEEFYPLLNSWFAVRIYPSPSGVLCYFQNINKRKDIEQKLRESEAQYRRIVETAQEGLWIINGEGITEFVNPRMAEMLGYNIEEMLGRPFFEFMDDVAQKKAEYYFERRQQGLQELHDFRFTHKNGADIWTIVSTNPIINEQGIFVGALATITDITARKKVEAELQKSYNKLEVLVAERTNELTNTNQLLRQEIAERQKTEAILQKEQEFLKVILDSVQAGIVACDAEGILTIFNPATREFHGLPEEQILAEEWAQYYDLYLPDGKTLMKKEDIPLFRALQGEDVRNVEMMIIPKQGIARTLLASGRAILDSNGKKQGAVVVMHDISDRKRAEEALLISDAALQQLPDAILLTDLQGNIVRWMGKAEKIFGYSVEEVIGKPVNFLHRPDIREIMTAKIIQDIQNTGRFFGEILCLRKDGSEVPIETTSNIVCDSQGKPLFFVGINKDITERKLAEAEREQLLQEQAARIEAQTAQQRFAFLAEASNILAFSLNYESTVKKLVNLIVPYLADYCLIFQLQHNGQLQLLAAKHNQSEKEELLQDLSKLYSTDIHNPNSLAGQVIRTGKSILIGDYNYEMPLETIKDPKVKEICCKLNPRSFIIVPLSARGHVSGAIILARAESERSYDSSDLSLAEELAQRTAIAIDNGYLYRIVEEAREAAERAADRISRLQAVTAALSQSLTPPQVANVILEYGVPALGAVSTLVVLVDESGKQLNIVCSFGYDQNVVEAWRCFPLDTAVPLADAIRNKEVIWEESTEQRRKRYPHLIKEYDRYNYGAWISLPLIVEGRAIGGISLSFNDTQKLNLDDRAFMLALAQQCAQAIDRARLYEAEQKARATAEAANRVKDEFLAIVSHELRTPLNSILGWSQMLRTRKFNESTTAKAMEIIERNARSQKQLIEDLLDISRIIRGKLNLNIRPIDLASVVNGAIESVSLAADAKNIQITTQMESFVGLVSGDSDRLQQVVWNLVSNAVKFTPEGGRVDVHLSLANIEEAVTPNSQSAISYAQIQVKDTGIGISSEFLPHVFEYFRQADGTITRTHNGLGLGLAIVRHLVELHGGTVEAHSEGVGQGANFTVKLPLFKDEKIAIKKEINSLVHHPSLKDLHLLIVDDEHDAREFLAFILEQYGAKVTAVSSAEEALLALENLIPDVLISDLGMPKEDGYSLIRKIRIMESEQCKQIPAIALTAYAREEDRQKAIAAGFQVHLSKPVDANELLKAITNLATSQ